MEASDTPGEINVEMKSEEVVAVRPSAAPKQASGMRRVSLVPPLSYPGLDVQDGLGGTVTITPQPRLVTVAVANALLRTARRAGNEFGLTENKIRIEEE